MKFGLFYELQLPFPHDDADVTRMFRETLDHVELAGATRLPLHLGRRAPLPRRPRTLVDTGGLAVGRCGAHRHGSGSDMASRACHRSSSIPHASPSGSGCWISSRRAGSSSAPARARRRMELEGFGVDPATKHEAYLEVLEQVTNMMAMTPYPGYEGEFFSMPCRNILPKPAQKPHPPFWVAGKPELAARLGMGCLGFNVVGGHQAKVMVDRYYDTLTEECVPIGHGVNPQMSVLATMHCNEDGDVARDLGSNLRFFGYTVAKYYVNGVVRPGRGDYMEEFERSAISCPTWATVRRPRSGRPTRSASISGRWRTPASTRCS